MNTKLLNQVANAILDEPRKFDISSWIDANTESPCGTTACIAGHAVAISRRFRKLKSLRKFGDSNIYKAAIRALGLESWAAERLFYRWQWPDKFDLYNSRLTVEERADVAFWRIQHFIATDGAE